MQTANSERLLLLGGFCNQQVRELLSVIYSGSGKIRLDINTYIQLAY